MTSRKTKYINPGTKYTITGINKEGKHIIVNTDKIDSICVVKGTIWLNKETKRFKLRTI